MHPGQERAEGHDETAGFAKVSYHNLTAGVVALHKGFKV
jgi:demethylmenaquinone methyltransferase/2-methoxy-6-polyprenyl-1,4-benzoquinol methylase